MGDAGDDWRNARDYRVNAKARIENNREQLIRLLEKNGISYERDDKVLRVVVSHRGRVFDFRLDWCKWTERGTNVNGKGMRELIAELTK